MTVISPPRLTAPSRRSAPDRVAGGAWAGAPARPGAAARTVAPRPGSASAGSTARAAAARPGASRRRGGTSGYRHACESATPPAGVRLPRWARLTLTLTVVFTALWLGAQWVGGGSVAPATTPVSTVTVQPGESVWQIATRVAPGADTRQVVQQIRELNDLGSGSALVPGVQLTVPSAG